MLGSIARASLWNRRFSVGLTIFTVAISVALLLTVERVRVETRQSFASTISGTDLIVGARTGPVQLLLYSVFRIGDATSNIRYRSFEELAALPQVAWAVPIALGDSHRGFRVLGTTPAYFEHFRYGNKRALVLDQGVAFADLHEAVLGAEVADRLGYRVGDAIVIAHGTGNRDIMTHDDQPFRVVGILARSGTPVDRTLHVSLQSLEAIHADWQHGVRIPQRRSPAAEASAHEHEHEHEHEDAHGDGGRDVHAAPAKAALPQTVTAIFVGLKNRAAAFTLQRQINSYTGEPLLAIMPAMTLAQLWSLVGVAESALMLVAVAVVVAGLLGMTTALVTTLNERRREMAILRALGARPWQVAALLLIESGSIALAGCLLGTLVVMALLALLAPWLSAQFGLLLHPLAFTLRELVLLLAILAGGLVAGLLPALLAWRRSLADGLTIRI
jgi:putative ABC transport system permease protein